MAEPRLYLTVERNEEGKGQVLIHRTTPTGKLTKVTALTQMEAVGFAADLLTNALRITEP